MKFVHLPDIAMVHENGVYGALDVVVKKPICEQWIPASLQAHYDTLKTVQCPKCGGHHRPPVEIVEATAPPHQKVQPKEPLAKSKQEGWFVLHLLPTPKATAGPWAGASLAPETDAT